jgi:hypothetical protein
MHPDRLQHLGVAIPGVFSVASNVSEIPCYPLIKKLLRTVDSDPRHQECPLGIDYVVSDRANSGSQLKGKTFERVDSNTTRLEIPLGGIGRLSMLLEWDSQRPRLTVNPTFHRLARVTLGNVHSAGWLVRDITNLVLLRNNYVLLHAAAIQHHDRVLVIFGLSNTGKTTSVFSMVRNSGARFFGDDLVLTDGINIHSCPHTGANVEPDRSTGSFYRIQQTMRRYVPFFENLAGTIPLSISTALGEKNVAAKAPVTDVIIMRRASSNYTNSLDALHAAKLMVASNRAEFTYPSVQLLNAGEFFETGVDVSDAVLTEARVLEQLASTARCVYAHGSLDYLVSSVKSIATSQVQP